MKTMGHDIGKGASLLAAFFRSENAMHEDVELFHAPSECHGLIRKGEARRFRQVRRHIKAATGLKFRIFAREMDRRCTPAAIHRLGL